MSVWAEKWAYEQPVKNAGAKFVLVALAGFADADGYSYYGQKTLAEMTSQTDRTVRAHLKQLEENGLIRRAHRYTKEGRRTSDGCFLNAPPERLKPQVSERLPENSSASKTHYRKSTTPLPENSSGELPENISAELSDIRIEQSDKSKDGSRARSPNVGKMSDEEFQTFLKSNPAYSHLDLVREAGKMRAYCAANHKQPTRRYFVAWLNRIDPPLIPPNGSPPAETREEKQKRLAERFQKGASP